MLTYMIEMINVVNDINNNRKNDKYIKDLIIPKNVTAYNDLDEALKEAKLYSFSCTFSCDKSMCQNL